MRHPYLKPALLLSCYLLMTNAQAQTQRIPLLNNEEVRVWKTIIYPNKEQILTPHRHDHNRVLIALDDGKLKITNNKGNSHYLVLKKEQAYYLAKDVPGELHTDENLSQHPIKVMVIELNK